MGFPFPGIVNAMAKRSMNEREVQRVLDEMGAMTGWKGVIRHSKRDLRRIGVAMLEAEELDRKRTAALRPKSFLRQLFGRR